MEENNKEELGIWRYTIKEITDPFIALFRSPKAIWGVNISYVLEGMCYFGIVGLLAMYFNQYVGLDDIRAGNMVGFLTAGITIAMLVLGATVDFIGVRRSLLLALFLMLIGRLFLAGAPEISSDTGLWGAIHWISIIGMLGIIIGYGIYQPASYAAVKKFTDKKNAAMGYAMLYALMNLGGFLPGLISPPVRQAFNITGVFWLYAIFTVLGILAVTFLITKKAMKEAESKAKKKNAELEGKEMTTEESEKEEKATYKVDPTKIDDSIYRKLTLFGLVFAVISVTGMILNNINKWADGINSIAWGGIALASLLVIWAIVGNILKSKYKESTDLIDSKALYYFLNFPISDGRFMFFIFILIPVQTLFAHNWLTLPQYCERAFTGVVSENFEFFVNFNPLLIFILTPMIAALTMKRKTYLMMITGTTVMALSPFILVGGANIYMLFAYLIVLTIGEAMWQPRFLQWVAEIAPDNMTGIYMGIGQFPWFLTKIVTSLYSGWFLMNYCPMDTLPQNMNTETMWLIYGFIAIISPIGLILAKKWMMKGFKG
jgi:MFS family permease